MIEWIKRWFGRHEASAATDRPVPPPDREMQACVSADAQFAAGERAYAAGRLDEAAAAFAAAIDQRHDWAEAHRRLGLCMHRLGRYEDACDSYELALHFAPELFRAYLDRAHSERRRGEKKAALASVRAAIAGGERSADAYNLEGALLLEAEDVAGAVAAFERAVERAPDDPDAHNNLGYVLFRDRAQYDRGASHIERAIELAPDNPGYLCNYTMVLAHRGEPGRAIELCDRLLERHPEMDEARLNRALALLKIGRFAEGWKDYEARKSVRCNYVPRSFPWPEWRGEPLAGKTIAIYGEQGLGDEIMFASCFADMLGRAGHCIVECEPRLETLFRRSFPAATIVCGAQSRKPPAWLPQVGQVDVQVAAGSLPLYLRGAPESFPQHAGYLVPDPDRSRRWRGRLDALGPGTKIGVSWRGGLQSTRRDLRSMDLATMAALFDAGHAHFVDLQYGDTGEERAQLESLRGAVLHSWPGTASDLEELAALVSELDLVVSVCTAVMHFAGALGKEVWVLVPTVPEWRYQQEGDRIPWYPTARMIRQRPGESWASVMERVSGQLERRLSGRGGAAAAIEAT